MKGLRKKIFLIVGGANGIGKATCKALINEGANVIIADFDEVNSLKLVEQYSNIDQKICFCKTDITKKSDIDMLYGYLKENYDVIHGVANIASKNIFTTNSTEFEDWYFMVEGSVAPYGIIVSLISELMIEGGSIVNMSSISGTIAQSNFGTYASSKAAISALTRCQALDLSKKNIRVNSICPGTIWTENNAAHIMQDFGFSSREEADKSPDIGGKHILGRCGNPEEVADVITFLLSKNSSFITGTELFVDGGYTVL